METPAKRRKLSKDDDNDVDGTAQKLTKLLDQLIDGKCAKLSSNLRTNVKYIASGQYADVFAKTLHSTDSITPANTLAIRIQIQDDPSDKNSMVIHYRLQEMWKARQLGNDEVVGHTVEIPFVKLYHMLDNCEKKDLPDVIANKIPDKLWNLSPSHSMLFTVMEYCPNSMFKMIHTYDIDMLGKESLHRLWLTLFQQVISSLTLFERIGFKHLDLHMDNVLVRVLDNPKNLEINSHMLAKTRFIALINDFDFATFNNKLGPEDAASKHIAETRPSVFWDLFKFGYSIMYYYDNVFDVRRRPPQIIYRFIMSRIITGKVRDLDVIQKYMGLIVVNRGTLASLGFEEVMPSQIVKEALSLKL